MSKDNSSFKSFNDLINGTDWRVNSVSSFDEFSKELKPSKEVQEISEAVDSRIAELKDEETESAEQEVEEEPIEEPVNEDTSYRIIKDKSETFECKISVEGASLSNSTARLILESDQWNFTMYGKISSDGKCTIPINKGIPLPNGSRGNARLEVIVDDQLFVGWEDKYVVESSKKISVSVNENRSVKVSFDKK